MSTALALSSAGRLALGMLAARRADGPADIVVRTGALLGLRDPVVLAGPDRRHHAGARHGLVPRPGHDRRAAAVWPGWRYVARRGSTTSCCPRSCWPPTSSRSRRAWCGRAPRGAGDRLRAHRARQGLAGTRRRAPCAAQRAAARRHRHRRAVGMLVTGAVLVETVFAWPGARAAHAVVAPVPRLPVLLGMFLLVSIAVVLVQPHDRSRLCLARPAHPLRVKPRACRGEPSRPPASAARGRVHDRRRAPPARAHARLASPSPGSPT